MAQPTIVGDSGRVNGKANGTSRTPHGASERPDAQGTSMKTRQSGRESSASSPSSRPSKGPERRCLAQVEEGGLAPSRHRRPPPLHRGRGRPLRLRRVGAPLQRHHEPRRFGRLQDGRRRDPAPTGRSSRPTSSSRSTSARPGSTATRSIGETQRSPGRLPHRAHDPRSRRDVRRLLRHARTTPTLRGRALVPARATSTARSTRRCGSTAGSSTATASTAPAATRRWDVDELGRRSPRRRTPTSDPQCSACFIQAVNDDLMSIYDLVKSEARLFKYGSGTGTNFSAIRGKQEKLSGGGTSVGPHELPRGARSRRRRDQERRHHAPRRQDGLPRHGPPRDRRLHHTGRCAKRRRPTRSSRPATRSDFNGDAYHTISGQNSNNSVRVTDEFMRAVESGGKWQTRARTTGEVCDTYERARTCGARSPRRRGAAPTPACSTTRTINRWHTCPNTGRINASNPCSEYMFLDDTACNLASLNLTKFLRRRTASFDIEGYRHAVPHLLHRAGDPRRLLELPDAGRSRRTRHDYRPLGLGYANLGTLLMLLRHAVRHRRGPRDRGALTAIMCGHAYTRVGRDGRRPRARSPASPRTASRCSASCACTATRPTPSTATRAPRTLWRGARARTGTTPCASASEHGYRNAQATVLAPTGTIGLLDGLRHDRHRARLRAGEVQEARRRRLLQDRQPVGARGAQAPRLLARPRCRRSSRTSAARTRCSRAPHVNRAHAQGARASPTTISRRSRPRSPASSISSSRSAPWVLGEEAYDRLGVTEGAARRARLLAAQAPRLHRRPRSTRPTTSIIGRMTIEGAPHLQRRALRGLRLRQPLRQDGQALPRADVARAA